MKWLIFVGLMILCIMMLIMYSLLVMASDTDDEAERMYREWKEREDGRFDKEV